TLTPLTLLSFNFSITELSNCTEEECPRRCSWGWKRMGHRCIRFYNVPQTFYRAERACRHAARRGHLISIHSRGQNHIIQAVVAKRNCRRQSIWIGGKRFRGSRRFYWVDGSSWNYSSWGCGALNESCRKQTCIKMNYKYGGRWSQISCRARRPYMCEYPLYKGEEETQEGTEDELEISAGVETKEEAGAM
uniref:C-type lectin domain-containing protein n=1 Tax=Lepisosteus oculatus TaxID=7918 RepID=W5M9W7_LEPOC